MDNENRKNYAIPRFSEEYLHNTKRKWALLSKQGDKWRWVALDPTMEERIVTATNFFEAFEAVQKEITDKPSA